VAFAGPYLELVLWAMATIAWRLTEPDTWINYTALIVMTLSGVRSFVDFNPFVKLDGYYLLSDYLELPNLRRRSFKYVGDGSGGCSDSGTSCGRTSRSANAGSTSSTAWSRPSAPCRF